MFFSHALFVLSLAGVVANTDTDTDTDTRDLPRVPSMIVHSEDGTESLRLIDLEVRVTLQGHLVRTEYVMTYENALDRELRAEFMFPLPGGAHLSDVGLYFGDRLRRAASVERTLARTAYENIVPPFISRRRDPILAEWATGDTFRYEVYPIFRRSEKKIYLSYDQELSGDAYALDLRYASKFRHFRLELNSADGARWESPLALDCASKRCVFDAENVNVDTRVSAHISIPERPTALLELGEDGDYYASIRVVLDALGKSYPTSQRVTLLWDVSGTASAQSTRVLEFLRRFIARQNGSLDIDVVPFHLWTEEPIRVASVHTDPGWETLQRTLGALRHAGATHLEGLAKTIRSGSRGSRLMLVTDGMSSFGPQKGVSQFLETVEAADRRLLVVNAAESFDEDTLRGIAEASKGWYVDLRKEAPSGVERLLDHAMTYPVFVTGATWDRALDASSGRPQALDASGAVALTARIERVVARGEIAVSLDGANGKVIRRVRFRTRRPAEEIGLIRSHWARERLSNLLVEGDVAAIRQHGVRYHLLTPETSLVVLETWRDYWTHGIEMPSDLHPVFEAFRERQNRWRRGVPSRAFLAASGGTGIAGVWTLTGRIVDRDGGILPGVAVSVQSIERGTTATSVTNAIGRFRIVSPVAPGAFRFYAELAGFQTIAIDFLEPISGGSELGPLVMQIGGVCESITVSVGGSNTSRRSRPPIEKTTLRPGASLHTAAAPLGTAKTLTIDAANAVRFTDPLLAIRLLSGLIEHDPESPGLARVVAQVIESWLPAFDSERLFLRAIEQAPHQHQSYVDWIRAHYVGPTRQYWDWVEDRGHRPAAAIRREVERALPREIASERDLAENWGLRVELSWDNRSADLDLRLGRGACGPSFLRPDVDVRSFGPELYEIEGTQSGVYRIVVLYDASGQMELDTATTAVLKIRWRRPDGRVERRAHAFVLKQGDDPWTTILELSRDDGEIGSSSEP